MINEIHDHMKREFRDPEARHDYAELFLDSSISLQIKALRLQRGWTQKELAKKASLHQSQISAMEQVTHSKWTLATLKKVAKAFDVSLRVSFDSFGRLLEDYVNQSREALERDSFDNDPAFSESNGANDKTGGPRRTGNVVYPAFGMRVSESRTLTGPETKHRATAEGFQEDEVIASGQTYG